MIVIYGRIFAVSKRIADAEARAMPVSVTSGDLYSRSGSTAVFDAASLSGGSGPKQRADANRCVLTPNLFLLWALKTEGEYMIIWYRGVNQKIWTYSSSRSSKVDDFGTNRKRICDFLLVINSNFGPILHRFWDTATYWLKIAYFSYPSLIRRPLSLCSLWNFAVKSTSGELVTGLLCGESCMILTAAVFDWSTRVTDRQTDGRTIAYSARYSIYAVAR